MSERGSLCLLLRRVTLRFRSWCSPPPGSGGSPEGDRRGPAAARPGVEAPSLSPGLVGEAVDRAGGRRRVRQALGVPSERISDEVIDELLAGASTEEEIAGPGGLLADLTKRLLERAMEVELTDHLGYEPHREPAGGAENQRNGSTGKTLITEHGRGGARRSARPQTAASSQRSSASASAGSSGSTRRSSRFTAAGSPHGTSPRTSPRSTA